ncbi:MAG: Fe-S cluster assembly protein HesB [Acidimicrobiales bacterium]|nr:Fe-S cluster assembly protein HesB [Acidimicrobiales bacterium]
MTKADAPTFSPTLNDAANKLLCKNSLALLIGMLLDQQIPMERAFQAPFLLRERLNGKLDAKVIAVMDQQDLVKIFSQKPALHRFPNNMATRVHDLCSIVVSTYSNKAENIWKNADTGQEALDAIGALPGFGQQKAKIFLAILGKRFNQGPPGWQKASDPYGKTGSHMSVADVDSPKSLELVREYKKSQKNAG